MKTHLKTVLLSQALILSSITFGQTNANFEMASNFTSYVSAHEVNFTPSVVYPESKINNSSFISPNMLPSKLTGAINSQYSEMGALISPDGKTLYFSRYQDPNNLGGKNDDEDIWYSEWDEKNNTWGEAKNIGAPLNNKFPNFINSISPDGNTILLGNKYLRNGNMLPGFSISHKTKTGWSFPEEINIKGIKKEHKLSGCFLSNDQEILLVAGEQRKDNFGERDLYVSFIKPDNTWTKPINLGEVINTKGNESAPFLSEDNSTLFYASDGLNGYGESDIYMTHRLDDTWKHWSQPENLGPIINTESNQSFFSISNGKMYFSSEYEKGEGLDILTLNAPHNEPSNNTNNTEQIIVSESKDLSVSSDLPVISADLNKSLSLIYFDFNRTDLKKATFYELERIAKALNQYPALQIEIDGHTDAVGSEKYNYELAQKRINTVLYYFIKQSNIDSKRILVKNYGETLPLESNLTEEGRKLNRRVEISFKTTLIVKN